MAEFRDENGSGISWPKPGDVAFTRSSGSDGAVVSQDAGERLVAMMIGYKEAADHLVQEATNESFRRNSLIYPIIFNYRQFIELNLKYLIATYGPAVNIPANWRKHNLCFLWGSFQAVLSAYGVTDPDHANPAVEAIVGEFSKIDPESFTFRYPVDTKGDLVPVDENELDLGRLKEVMASLYHFFSGSDGYLDHLSKCAP